MLNDIRFAFRMLLKNPGFTAVAVLSLALGIGANTTVFCWIQNVLLRPFPGATAPEQLVVLCSRHGSTVYDTVSYVDIQDYATLKETFSGVIGSQVTPACLTIQGKAEWIFGQITTANFFDVLGVKAFLGRTFLAEEELRPGGSPVLVLSYGFWKRRFGGDPGVIGTTVDINRTTFTIVGVAPQRFRGSMSGVSCDFWAPVVMHEQVAHFGNLRERSDRWLHTMARLQPGVTRARAQAAVSTMASHLAETFPVNREIDLKIFPPWQSPYGGQAVFLPVMRILAAVSLGVLLIVAANVANLLLARFTGRQKEIAIRLALGAGRARLVRQLLTECLVLAFLGAALGVLFASWASGLLVHFIPNTHLPIGYSFDMDFKTLAYTLVLTLATGLVFGLAPTLQARRTDLNQTLKEGGRTSGSEASHHHLRGVLVVAEVALALLLLIGAGLCIKGSQKARQIDAGFEPSHALLAGLRIGAHGYTEQTGKVFYHQLRERMAAVPGVQEAALASWFPLGFEGGPSTSVTVDGYQRAPNEDVSVSFSIISPRYFEAMRIPILQGRDFAVQDDADSARVAIINENMAKRFWPGQNPLGRIMRIWGDRNATVVGIVKSGKYRSLNEPPRPFFFLPYQQGVWDLNLGVVLRTTADPAGFIATLRQEVHRLDPGVEVWAAITAKDYVEASFLPQRIAATLLVGLGIVALVLAAMGIYGVMAYVVSQRTHEIGIRMALGAKTMDVTKMILAQGMTLAGIGMAIGLGGAVAVTRLLSNFLYGVSPFDPVTFMGVPLILGVVTLLACLVPAQRATRVDPMIALRCE